MRAFILVHLKAPAKHLFVEELDFPVEEIFHKLEIYDQKERLWTRLGSLQCDIDSDLFKVYTEYKAILVKYELTEALRAYFFAEGLPVEIQEKLSPVVSTGTMESILNESILIQDFLRKKRESPQPQVEGEISAYPWWIVKLKKKAKKRKY